MTSTATSTQTPPAPRPVATCSPGVLDWSFNSRGQSPCIVASTLGGVCFTSSYTLPQLPPEGDYHYRGIFATGGEDNPCLCNTVYYSLESACAACQHRLNSWDRWLYWSTNCSTTYTTYPRPIPPSVAIPAWAYLDVASGNTFNVTLAEQFAPFPESAAPTPTSTSTSVVSITSITPQATSTSASPAGVTSSPKQTNNTGAIVGGAVGGLAVVLLAVLLAVFLFRRKKKRGTALEPPRPMLSALNTGTTLQPPQSPVSYYENSAQFSVDGNGKVGTSPVNSDFPKQYYSVPQPFGGDPNLQYSAQSLPYSAPTISHTPPTSGNFPRNPVIGQTYYKGVPETMQ